MLTQMLMTSNERRCFGLYLVEVIVPGVSHACLGCQLRVQQAQDVSLVGSKSFS